MILSPPLLIAAGAIGAIIGSFVGAMVLRLPRRETIVTGRSHCDGCGRSLSAHELIPVLSYFLQLGRCRGCGSTIAIDQPIAECGGAIVGVIGIASAPSMAGALLLALFGWALLALALLDARHLWLPDAITLPLISLGLLASALVPDVGLGERLLGALLGYGLLEGLRRAFRYVRGREGLGAGDAKLLAAIGAWLGVRALPWIVLAAAVLGLALVATRKLRGDPLSRSTRLPLGTLLAIAAIVAMPITFGVLDQAGG